MLGIRSTGYIEVLRQHTKIQVCLNRPTMSRFWTVYSCTALAMPFYRYPSCLDFVAWTVIVQVRCGRIGNCSMLHPVCLPALRFFPSTLPGDCPTACGLRDERSCSYRAMHLSGLIGQALKKALLNDSTSLVKMMMIPDKHLLTL